MRQRSGAGAHTRWASSKVLTGGVLSRSRVWGRWSCGWGRVVESTAGAESGHVRAERGGASGPNNALEPTPTAFARPSLRLLAAPDAWRSAEPIQLQKVLTDD